MPTLFRESGCARGRAPGVTETAPKSGTTRLPNELGNSGSSGKMSFGQRLRGLRRDFDLSQARLGDRAGCAANTVRKLESDERRPSRELGSRLCEGFELSPRERAEFLRLARGGQSAGR